MKLPAMQDYEYDRREQEYLDQIAHDFRETKRISYPNN